MIPVSEDQIGGAIVRRRIDRGDASPLRAGQRLSREEVLAMAPANRRALVNSERIWLAPRAETQAADNSASRIVVHRGGGLYDVIVGYRLNDEGLSKADAEALASHPA